MVIVICSPDTRRFLQPLAGQSAVFLDDWMDLHTMLPDVDGVVAVKADVTSPSFLSNLRSLRRRSPFCRIAVACDITSENINALAGVEYDRFVPSDELETAIREIIVQLGSATVKAELVRALEPYCESRECLDIVTYVFMRDPPPKSDCELSQFIGQSLKHVRGVVKRELGEGLHALIRWNILIAGVELWARQVREPELSTLLAVSSTTLARNARALLGVTFGQAAVLGPDRVAAMLLQRISGDVRDAGLPPAISTQAAITSEKRRSDQRPERRIRYRVR